MQTQARQDSSNRRFTQQTPNVMSHQDSRIVDDDTPLREAGAHPATVLRCLLDPVAMPTNARTPRTSSRWLLLTAAAVVIAGAAAFFATTPSTDGEASSAAVATPGAAGPRPVRFRYAVVATYPHDANAFTQGLLFRDGVLYESTGCGGGAFDGTRCLDGGSSLRKVELETGRVLQRRDIDRQYFAEGLVDWNDSLIQLTWQSGVGFVYDVASFEPRRQFAYEGEGWGLTRDDTRLFMSDGSSTLRVLDPESLAETSRLPVTERGLAVSNLNELEMVRGEIFANIWQSDDVVVIAPDTGHVTARIDFSGLRARLDPSARIDVLNGIAYDPSADRLWVTGKLWPLLFEVRIIRE